MIEDQEGDRGDHLFITNNSHLPSGPSTLINVLGTAKAHSIKFTCQKTSRSIRAMTETRQTTNPQRSTNDDIQNILVRRRESK